ncbi:phage holin family protein [Streptomyces sediminimaris]|uniref:phage holin family protein n=1 Tax=Streptomyces sediminimaris TaxID=3383721 RepID=UPI00399A8A19
MRAREEGTSPDPGGRVGDAAGRLAQDAADLARREIKTVQDEAMTGLRRVAASGTLLAGAGVCGILALWAAHETVLRTVEQVLPGARASAVLACGYTTGAVAFGLAARNRMRAAAEAAAEALEHEHDRATPAPTVVGEQRPQT